MGQNRHDMARLCVFNTTCQVCCKASLRLSCTSMIWPHLDVCKRTLKDCITIHSSQQRAGANKPRVSGHSGVAVSHIPALEHGMAHGCQLLDNPQVEPQTFCLHVPFQHVQRPMFQVCYKLQGKVTVICALGKRINVKSRYAHAGTGLAETCAVA